MIYYIISDLHGKAGSIKNIDNLIKDYNINGKDSKLVINGDCIDGGKEGFDLLYRVKELVKNGKAIFLRGNHERFFLDWLEINDSLWVMNDYKQYGIKSLLKGTLYENSNIKSDYGVLIVSENGINLANHIKEVIKEEHKELVNWLKNSPNYLELNTAIIVHAGLNFSKDDIRYWKTTPKRVMESINPKHMLPNNSGKWLVLGHFWAKLFHESNDIFIDKEDKRIQIDGDILNGGQFNVLGINDEDGSLLILNNLYKKG